MTVFMRSQTWISGAFGDAAMLALGLDPKEINCELTKPDYIVCDEADEPAKSHLNSEKLLHAIPKGTLG